MRRWKGFLIVPAGAILLLLLLLGRLHSPSPNLLLITLHATRADRLGCYGNPDGLTPTLDELAAQGVLFERAYAAAPMTLPSHASLFTGFYPPEHGVRDDGGDPLPREIPALAEVVKRAGYDTAAFVASSALSRRFGLDRGFDTYEDVPDEHDSQACVPAMSRRPGQAVVDSVLSWLRDRSDRPFFCWVHLADAPQPPDQHSRDQSAGRAYDAAIAAYDRHVRRLLDFLESRGLRRNTLIIVAADHGQGLGDHGELSHSYLAYNSTVHVPLILSHPGRMVTGYRPTDPLSLTDVFPSVVEWLNLPLPEPVRGTSVASALRGEPVGPRLCYVETEAAYRRHGWAPLHCVVTNEWKYIRTRTPELYDMQTDPHEAHNLAAVLPERCQQLDSMLAGMSSEMVPYGPGTTRLSGIDRAVLQTLGPLPSHAGEVRKITIDDLRDVNEMMPLLSELAAARAKVQARDYGAALQLLQHVAGEAPELAEAHSLLGVCYEALGQPEQAASSYRDALTARNPPACAHYRLGTLLLVLQRPGDAVPHLQHFVELNPDSLNGQRELGIALAEVHRLDTAEQALREALRIDPRDAPALIHLGIVLRAQGRCREAVALLSAGLKCKPEADLELRAKYHLSWICATAPDDLLRKGDEALALAEEICRATHFRQPEYLDALAAAYAELGRFEDAVSTAERALALLRPEDTELTDALRQRVELYRARRAYREESRITESPNP